jgi:hypothetical protein
VIEQLIRRTLQRIHDPQDLRAASASRRPVSASSVIGSPPS